MAVTLICMDHTIVGPALHVNDIWIDGLWAVLGYDQECNLTVVVQNGWHEQLKGM
jgi:hypothetical protein